MRALIGVLLLSLAACTSAPPAPAPPSPAPTSEAPAEQVYLSLGDSYAAGYSPTGRGRSFADVVAEKKKLKLINLACSGVTSAQLRSQPGCSANNQAPGAPDPGNRTQLDAAVQALKDNRVALVTVIIGGNDLAPCAFTPDPITCGTQAVETIRTNLAQTLATLRAAAPDVEIIGLTYPDVFLGAWVSPTFRNGKDLATRSVPLFRDFFNPALKAEYEKTGAKFADVTAATGAYQPLTELTQDPTHGRVPAAVAKACALTYFCDQRIDVHPKPAGHEAIAAVVTGG